MNNPEMSRCPAHPIIDASIPPESTTAQGSGRLFALNVSIGESLYQKLILAHQRVRLSDGSRLDLRTLLEQAVDALLKQRSVRATPRQTPSAAVDREEEEPPTVRAPTTMRWSAIRRD
jgi:hypothetical protein